jgi:type II secretory pathway pseudopilin PulG
MRKLLVNRRGISAAMAMIALIVVSVLSILAIIAVPMYQRSGREKILEQPKPLLQAIIDKERALKKEQGKFWRGSRQVITPEEAREHLGVDLSAAPDFQFEIYPEELHIDPTLSVAAKGHGEAQGILIECIYDVVEDHSHCTTADRR